ncbi:hypothetical protein WM40_14120 [Robbsia andropogonis]|uniref:XapX domain-containing protein n=1 Tax=Robbsia andropogonis TaxID=28092 RepID=A0A0F5JYU7_9BURK|nr:DUF1427 family protein [Robbsia andropogonis]KKB62998.1 hypothetical protein WM40_14120 [Robbsia andropogonis]MCP1120345.1 XapX domain-containing protein [Robbsia andropogonis]MCP1130216.1 XapX domain-containing protein [Robbsia andropogonis]
MSYLLSLLAGIGVGLLYWAFRIQSPAPPLVALTGLLGMVIGEHAVPIVKTHFAASSLAQAPDRHPIHLLSKEKFRKTPTSTEV